MADKKTLALPIGIGAVLALLAVVALFDRTREADPAATVPSSATAGSAANAPVAGTPGTPPLAGAALNDGARPSSLPAPPARSLLPAPPPALEPGAPSASPHEVSAGAGGSAGAGAAAEGEPKEAKVWTADAEGIRGAVRDSLPQLKDCYEQWLKLEPNMAGKLAVKFAITSADPDAGDGSIARIQNVKIASSELAHPFMEGCVQSVFNELQFTPPEGGKTEVTYPLSFSSSADAGS